MRGWRVAIGSLLVVTGGMLMLPSSSAQIPPIPTLPPFTFPTFTIPPPPTLPPPTLPPFPSSTSPPPTMPPPTTTPPPTMPPPTTTPPPTMPPPTSPPTSIGGPNIDQLIVDIIDQLEQFGDRFQDIIDQLLDLQSQF
jgi:hypothetical protein